MYIKTDISKGYFCRKEPAAIKN